MSYLILTLKTIFSKFLNIVTSYRFTKIRNKLFSIIDDMSITSPADLKGVESCLYGIMRNSILLGINEFLLVYVYKRISDPSFRSE